MKEFIFSDQQKVLFLNCETLNDINKSIGIIFNIYNILPAEKQAHFLLKTNFNNDINGLMSNSTDLRVIAGIVKNLQKMGYRNITIADGPNGGIVRREINVFKRLRIDRLAHILGIKYLDLNQVSGKTNYLTNKEEVQIAKICLETDFFINVPKIKTHWEAGLSLTTKNIIGCLQKSSKKKMHFNFFPNLIRLNEIIKPRLHIVDGLVAMEGQGPGDGQPKLLNIVVAGTNNYLVDLVIAKLTGFEPEEIGYLDLARKKDLINHNDIKTAKEIKPITRMEKAYQRKITKIATSQKLTSLRNLFRPMFQSSLITKFLHHYKITQDIYVNKDDKIESLKHNPAKCDQCGKCRTYCPMNLDPCRQLNHPQCCQCLYCAMICPSEAISIQGELGFLKSQMERYSRYLKNL